MDFKTLPVGDFGSASSDDEPPRVLERRQPLATVAISSSAVATLVTGRRVDEGGDLFAELRVGHADHGGLGHRRDGASSTASTSAGNTE